MGGCIPEASSSSRPGTGRKPNESNPIVKIIEEYGTSELQQRWKECEIKMVKNKMMSLRSENISFSQFQQLFPKIKDFSQSTELKIYELFNYENNQVLTRKELFKALTLIRKVPSNSDFAPFLFYIYTSDPRHEVMTSNELALFHQENVKYCKHLPSEDELEEEEDDELLGGLDVKLKKHGLSENVAKLRSLRINPKGRSFVQRKQEAKMENGQRRVEREIEFEEFREIFSVYDLIAYQIMFSWDAEEEEQELVEWVEKKGIVREKGSKVCVVEYKWWLEWASYCEQKYGKQIQLKEDNIQNYPSAKIARRDSRFSLPKLVEPLHQTAIPPPGEIKNGRLLKKTKDQGTELLPNLVELDDFICVPEVLWNKLMLVYHGGPPIERIYPEIYRRYILKVMLNVNGKFQPKVMKRFIWKDHQNFDALVTTRDKNWLPYYKYPGKSNWMRLEEDPTTYDDVFNYPRIYLVMVPPGLEKKFLENYNIQEQSAGKVLRKRLKNYGEEINISVDGVLTKAEVTDILSNDLIRVWYLNQEGRSQSLAVRINGNLEVLNPENLGKGNLINELAGLNNLGNTCYMNAILQCLIRTPYFGKYLQNQYSNYLTEIGQKGKAEQDLILKELGRLCYDSKGVRQETVDTRAFKKIFDRFCPFFEGNMQHDAQEFLICLLERISEQIKSKKMEYGSQIDNNTQNSDKSVNKRVIKFFSGKTEALTSCVRCHNKNTRVESFFTYSLSLPEMKEAEYNYYYVESPQTSARTVPVRYGLTLDRKLTVQKFLQVIGRTHHKPIDELALFTVFNNQILSHLEARCWQNEVAHYLSFNVKLVCYQVQHMYSPTYYNYQNQNLGDKSVKIELRQRTYSAKTHQYSIAYMPFLLEITSQSYWKDLVTQTGKTIAKLMPDEVVENSPSILKSYQGKNQLISPSSIKVQLEEKQSPTNGMGIRKSISDAFSSSRSLEAKYKIRVIKNDHYHENYCVFCKEEFVLAKGSRGLKTCQGKCGFNPELPLFKDQEFRNINDLIIVTVDWQEDLPLDVEPFSNHPSYDQACQRAEARKDRLEDLLIANYKTNETLELRCDAKGCGHEYAERIENIAVPPNILLLHLKRFRYEDNRLVKLTNNVVYPQRMTLPGSNQKYELYGVVVHLGSGVGGHYVSYVRVNQKWYKCDDTKVSLAEPGHHIDTNAYLLFYNKIDFEPSLVYLSF